MKFSATAIFVSYINVSKDFYTRLLNFTIEHDFGNNISFNEGLALWAVQEQHMISQKLKTKNESNKFEIYLEDDNLESVFEQLQKKS